MMMMMMYVYVHKICSLVRLCLSVNHFCFSFLISHSFAGFEGSRFLHSMDRSQPPKIPKGEVCHSLGSQVGSPFFRFFFFLEIVSH